MQAISAKFLSVRATLAKKPYSLLVYPLSTLYLIGTLLTYTYIFNGNPFHFYLAYPAWFTITFSLLTVVISILVGIAITLFIAKIHELRAKSAGLGLLGIFFGSLAAGCPGCVFGIFPVLLSLLGFGGGITLAILPFNGIEFQVLTVILMLLSIYFLADETDVVCDLPKKK